MKAIHDEDLKALLMKLNLYEPIQQGKVKCKFTRTIITMDNLHSIFPEAGTIKVVCDSPEAIKLLSNYLYERKI